MGSLHCHLHYFASTAPPKQTCLGNTYFLLQHDAYTPVMAKYAHIIFIKLFSQSFKKVVVDVEILKRLTSHTFRHSFATRMLVTGHGTSEVQ